MAHVLFVAKQMGGAQALCSVIDAFYEKHGTDHSFDILSTGSETEGNGFNGAKHRDQADETMLESKIEDYEKLVNHYNIIVAATGGANEGDVMTINAANNKGIPTIAVLDANSNYHIRFGDDPQNVPLQLAVMSEDCISALAEQNSTAFNKLNGNITVTGFSKYDRFQQLRDEYKPEDGEGLLQKLTLDQNTIVFFSQINHPSSANNASYCHDVASKILEAATSFNRPIAIRPHPGEKDFKITSDLANRFGATYLHPDGEYSSQDLMLAIREQGGIIAGVSASLNDGCLLDVPTAAFVPGLKEKDYHHIEALGFKAVPAASNWRSSGQAIDYVTKEKGDHSKARERFSVDGKAGERVVALIEEYL